MSECPLRWLSNPSMKSPARNIVERIVPQVDGSKLLLLPIPVGSRRG
jgi:hypothetical protein